MKDEEIVQLFFDVSRLNHQFSQTQPRSMGPFRGQYRCLYILKQSGTITQKELAEILSIRPASVSEILLRMEQKGWVRRTASGKDKRISLISLTEEGQRQAEIICADRARYHSNMLSELTESDKEHFAIALQKIKAYYISMMEDKKQ